MTYNVIDLFSGCGGLIEGFLQSGDYYTLAAVDWEKAPIETLRNRFSSRWNYDCIGRQNIIHFDLQRTNELLCGYNDGIFGEGVGLNNIIGKQKVDVIVGGPPCQAYSMAGRVQDKNGMQNDYRNFLFESYVRMVNRFNPKAFIFENVEGILSSNPGGVFITDRIRRAFEEIGYDVSCDFKNSAIFDLSYFDVPQARKRVIIFGVPKSKSSQTKIQKFYELINEQRSENRKNASHGLKGLPKIFPCKEQLESKISHYVDDYKDLSKILNHEPRFHNQRDIGIFKTLAEDILTGTNKYSSTKALIELYKERTGKTSKFHKYHVIRPNKPSNTIPAHLYKDGLRHIHPDPKQARTITVREAARLQTFPDDFEFLGSKGDQYKMVGNAVPPTFSKIIAGAVKETLY